jgi:hypothetical protein
MIIFGVKDYLLRGFPADHFLCNFDAFFLESFGGSV